MDCSPPGSSIHGIFQSREYWSGVSLPSPQNSKHSLITTPVWRCEFSLNQIDVKHMILLEKRTKKGGGGDCFWFKTNKQIYLSPLAFWDCLLQNLQWNLPQDIFLQFPSFRQKRGRGRSGCAIHQRNWILKSKDPTQFCPFASQFFPPAFFLFSLNQHFFTSGSL